MRARVVVIGGGVMGVSIAWHLAARLDPHAEPVVLLEKTALAAGSSGRSGAILRQFYGDAEVAGMARDSLRVFRSFEARTGRPIGWMPSGVLTIASRAKTGEAELVEKNVAMMRSIGIDVELLDARALRSLVPGIAASDATIAAWEKDAGGVDPIATVHAFAALAREAGAVTRIGVRATEIVVERGRIVAVETNEGRVACDRCVVAAGPWARPLLAKAGVELPLRIVRPEQHFVRMLGGVAEPKRDEAWRTAPPASSIDALLAERDAKPPSAPHPVLLDLEHGFYSRCDVAAGTTRVGHMDYASDAEVADPDRLDERVSDAFRRWARAKLALRMPRYADEPDVDAFAAMYTLTPDAQAALGPAKEVEGLYVACGFSGHGFKLSPSIGEGLAQMVLGEPVSAFEPRFFDPARFARGVARAGAFGL